MTKLSRRAFLVMTGALGLGWRAWGADRKSHPERFSFAVINDTHIVDAASVDILKQAVARINEIADIRFSVVAGDISQNCQREQFEWAKQALDGLRKPYKTVPGNHDVEGKNGLAYSDYTRCFGARNWMFEDGGWFFIGLDSCDGSSSDVSIPTVRLAWLKEQLNRIPADRPIALFAHHPFNPHAPSYRVRNADKVLEVFSGHRLRLVASGHWHGNLEETQNGILFTTSACCASTRENHDLTTAKGFRLFHVENDQIKTEFVSLVSASPVSSGS